jgi:hypothetical protein
VCRYALEQGTMPVRNYEGTLRVTPEGDDRARVDWSAEFECDAELEDQLTGVFEQGIFGPGLEALRARYALTHVDGTARLPREVRARASPAE